MHYGYGYGYDYPGGYFESDETVLAAVLSIYLIVITVVLIFALISYIFHSLGMYTIGRRMGKEHAWLAFIPFARDYFHGELAGEIMLKNRKIRNPGIWKLILPIISGVVTGGFSAVMIFSFSILFYAEGIRGLGQGILTVIVLLVILSIFLLVYKAVYLVLRVLINIQIFGRFTTRNMAVAHSVLSVILPLYEAICMFVMRDRPFYSEEHFDEPSEELREEPQGDPQEVPREEPKSEPVTPVISQTEQEEEKKE